jgi:hypothetical protein
MSNHAQAVKLSISIIVNSVIAFTIILQVP